MRSQRERKRGPRRRPAGWLAAALLAAAALPPTDAGAADIFMTRTNADLMKYCRVTVATFDAVRRGTQVTPATVRESWDLATAMAGCQGFIEGFREAMIAATRSSASVGLFNLVCLPDEATTHELATVYVRWGEANADKYSASASMGVYRAWREAWPCQVTVKKKR